MTVVLLGSGSSVAVAGSSAAVAGSSAAVAGSSAAMSSFEVSAGMVFVALS